MLNDHDLRDLAALMRQCSIGVLELEQPGQRLCLRVSADAAMSQVPDAATAQMLGEDGSADALGTVKAPSLGIFRHSHPDGLFTPCRVGELVQPSQMLAFLQIGVLLLPVVSTVFGRIVEILAADGTLVGYGTSLFTVDHSAA